MFREDKININITNKNKKYYINKGYNIVNKSLLINIDDLPKNSIVKINVKCENCKSIKNIQYRNYLKSKLTYNKYFCNKCCHIKSKNTYKKNNNIEYIFLNKDFIKLNKKRNYINRVKKEIIKKEDKIKNIKKRREEKKIKFINIALFIHLNKYNYSLSNYKINKDKIEIICNICGEHFFQTPSNHINHKQNCSFCGGKEKTFNNKFKEYSNKVRKETYKYRKKLLHNWNGFDFYDNEYIKDNFNLEVNDNNYPNIDHKISIRYGFDNNISIKKIGNIDNLCVTKRIINIKKGKKIIETNV